jgi:N-dimethylarginine dimethylaminohydrolase
MNIHATLGEHSQPRFLMCPPRHFAVTYSINPWMDPQAWARGANALHDEAARQWAGLRRALIAAGATIEELRPRPGLPDLVFAANAAVVLNRRAMLARFRHPQRQGEEPVFASAFRALRARGLLDEVATLPDGVMGEGAGDCLFDVHRGVFWTGSGFRSDPAAGDAIAAYFGVPCLPLPLADPSFYHLDTAFCALPCGSVMYYPAAFAPAALATLHDHVAVFDRIALDRDDAARFAANAVCVGRTIIMSRCSLELRQRLEARGYTVTETPLDIFLRSGGSACCLTLRLDRETAQSAGASPARQVKAQVQARG